MLAVMSLLTTGAAVAMSAGPLPPMPARYSIAFVLTDDQDLTLASLKYMPKTRRLLSAEGGEGITFSSMFATTPVCCPSRSSYMSGMYQHNTRCLANSVKTGCDGPAARVWEPNSLSVHLQRAGCECASLQLFGRRCFLCFPHMCCAADWLLALQTGQDSGENT